MPTGNIHDEPCAGLQVVRSKVENLERWQETQNGHLANLDDRVEELVRLISNNRQERSDQINRLSETISMKFSDFQKQALFALIPVIAGLLYIILNHVLVK